VAIQAVEVVVEMKSKKRRRREEDILLEQLVEVKGLRAKKRPHRFN
jgi:hypothetical protein